MTTIIAGRFQTSEQTDRVAAALAALSIPRDRISVFYNSSPGQHNQTPVGGDQQESPGLERAEQGAGTGAAIGAGLGVAGALVGVTAGLAAPLVAVAGLGAAAAGAFGGSLAGAMAASEDPGVHHIRHAGMMVAVDAGDASVSDIARVLRDGGAVDVESAQGTWADGTWDDFDPSRPPTLLDATTAS